MTRAKPKPKSAYKSETKCEPVEAEESGPVGTALAEAAQINHLDRSHRYANTAEMWSAFLRQRAMALGHTSTYEFTGLDVALFMAMHEMVEVADDGGAEDHMTEIAGFAATAELCVYDSE